MNLPQPAPISHSSRETLSFFWGPREGGAPRQPPSSSRYPLARHGRHQPCLCVPPGSRSKSLPYTAAAGGKLFRGPHASKSPLRVSGDTSDRRSQLSCGKAHVPLPSDLGRRCLSVHRVASWKSREGRQNRSCTPVFKSSVTCTQL